MEAACRRGRESPAPARGSAWFSPPPAPLRGRLHSWALLSLSGSGRGVLIAWRSCWSDWHGRPSIRLRARPSPARGAARAQSAVLAGAVIDEPGEARLLTAEAVLLRCAGSAPSRQGSGPSPKVTTVLTLGPARGGAHWRGERIAWGCPVGSSTEPALQEAAQEPRLAQGAWRGGCPWSPPRHSWWCF